MIELKQIGDVSKVPTELAQGFAGDVFNAAVYLKRCFADIETQLFTALGEDEFSQRMKDYFLTEGLDNDLVLTSKDKLPGLYAIQTDGSGERSFTYWRSDSAARYVMDSVSDREIETLKQKDMFFFSGISLAILQPKHRERFWHLVALLKEQGVQIVFDPNYRQRLWNNKDETISLYEHALQLSDIVMPGIEDFGEIYDHTSFDDVEAFCQPYQINELVIKDGPNGVRVVTADDVFNVEIEPVKNVVDTTSAGDSFNGAYLGARLSGHDVIEAVKLAARIAGVVIQHPGAIVAEDKFQSF